MRALGSLLFAAASSPVTEVDPDVDTARTVEAIVKATRTLPAEREGVERVIPASSCNVSGETNAEHLLETADPTPRNPYAESRLPVERACRESTLKAVCRRLATNDGWGPGIGFNVVINDFVFRALHEEPLTVYGDGTNWWPFIHVQDSARAFRSELSRDPGVHNMGEANLRLDDVVAAISDAVGRLVETTYLEDGDSGPSYQFDVSKMRGQGSMPETGFLECIKQLVERFRPRRIAGDVHG